MILCLTYCARARSNARYVESNYIAGSYVFSNTYGLAAVSSTKTGGMLGDKYFYGNFSGQSLGFAFQSWLTEALAWGEYYDKWFYGMTIIGDPTLRLVNHDIGALSVTPSMNEIIQGETINIDITIENHGSFPETFDIRCFSSTKRKPIDGAWVVSMIWIDIGEQQVISLAPGAFITLTFTWDTSSLEAGWYYDISVRADLPKDADPDDNYYSLPFYLHVLPPTAPGVPEYSIATTLMTSILVCSWLLANLLFRKKQY